MDPEKIGGLISSLRRAAGLTQRQLAEGLSVSDKAVSKWERGQGCPDISLLPALSAQLGVNIDQILKGELETHDFVGGNMKKARYFVCPDCGNLTLCTGQAAVSCCGKPLSPLTPQKAPEDHRIHVEAVEDEWFLASAHPMTKEHYLSFVAFATGDRVHLVKQYPEWNLQVRLPKREHGMLLWHCTRHGLFYQYI